MPSSNNTKTYESLLQATSRYMTNLNPITYDDKLMYDIPYKVSSPESSDDSYIVITTYNQNRLDKISNDAYGTPRYWWTVANVNNIINPFEVPYNALIRLPQLNILVLNGVIV